MSLLQQLFEQRDAADAAYTSHVTPIIGENRSFTPEEDEARASLRSRVEEIDARIGEVEADEQRAASIAEARQRALGAAAGDAAAVGVRSEPRVYGPESPNSYYADITRMSHSSFKDHTGALGRLQRYSVELDTEIRDGSAEGKRARRLVREQARTENGAEARDAVRRAEERAALTTGSASDGAFVTPVYMLDDYAPFREAGRPFADACNKQPLPDYGMTIYIPAVQSAASVAAQAAQNTGIAEADPTSGYLSQNLTILAGQVTVSQALLDRAGPGFAFDKMIFDQLNRDYDRAVDVLAITSALAGAGTVPFATGTISVPTLYSKVGGAKAAVATTSGVVMSPTHAFFQPTRWEWMAAQTGADGRAIIVPTYAGPYNALGAGPDAGNMPTYEGFTGYKFNGLPVFEDLNIPAPGSGTDQIVVGNLNEVFLFEGEPVARTVPQTLAQNLSVLLQQYSYCAVIPRYPLAIQSVAGASFTAPTF
jgi:hypothetical protein